MDPSSTATTILPSRSRAKKTTKQTEFPADYDPSGGEQAATVNAHDNVQTAAAAAATAAKPKRGRKPKAVYSNFDALPDFLQSTSDDENIIMKLQVTSQDVEDNMSQIDEESLPDAYNECNHDSYSSKPCEVDYEQEDDDTKKNATNNSANVEAREHTKPALKVIDLLKDFEEKNKNNEWPQTTSICCYWCCNRFDTPPFGIPVKYTGMVFHVFGCFCSLECAMAHNLASKESIDEIWERNNLINLLSRKIGHKNVVKPAPNRLALKMFGGHLDIDEYRAYCDTSKIININFPPMMTMTQQIEEINESDINNDYKYIPIDTDRINKYKEKIKLKRTKPLTTFENTLDHAMNLKFGAGSPPN